MKWRRRNWMVFVWCGWWSAKKRWCSGGGWIHWTSTMMDIPKHDDGKKREKKMIPSCFCEFICDLRNIQGFSIRQCACAARHDNPTYTYACVSCSLSWYGLDKWILCILLITNAPYTTWWTSSDTQIDFEKWQIKRGEKVCFSLFVEKVWTCSMFASHNSINMQELDPPFSFVAAYLHLTLHMLQ